MSAVLTDVGEIGIYTSDARFVLRPTLRAMAAIGEPAEIIQIFASVYGPTHPFQHFDALRVLNACADGFEPLEVIGFIGEDEASGGLKYNPERVPQEHLVPLARDLLKHGIVGDVKARSSGDESGTIDEFVARDYAALAVAHLGMNERDSWDLTMTSLVVALRTKFPDAGKGTPGAGAPTKEQHEKSMDWFEEINRKRKARKNQAVH